MDTDSNLITTDQCLLMLAEMQVNWWDYFAITQQQSDQITILLVYFFVSCLSFVLVAKILKTL